ncbi:MAG: hypothetical protein VX803_05045 [Pseudomonadota bacterium]|nr:hypothetical protein [Alphaproteobacteria bacterium]MCS5596395.1 hypothetical protein [Alphaproteobacteria bacterium]MEC9235596.1 hypothetical protein [Pseudomonadota bacterium]
MFKKIKNIFSGGYKGPIIECDVPGFMVVMRGEDNAFFQRETLYTNYSSPPEQLGCYSVSLHSVNNNPKYKNLGQPLTFLFGVNAVDDNLIGHCPAVLESISKKHRWLKFSFNEQISDDGLAGIWLTAVSSFGENGSVSRSVLCLESGARGRACSLEKLKIQF